MTTPAGSEQDALAQRLRDTLAHHRDVREVRMFGSLSFMVNDRMAVAAGGDGDLLVRVQPADYDNLLQRGAMPAIMGKDRPMGRSWMYVPRQKIEEDAELVFWVTTGVDSGNV